MIARKMWEDCGVTKWETRFSVHHGAEQMSWVRPFRVPNTGAVAEAQSRRHGSLTPPDA